MSDTVHYKGMLIPIISDDTIEDQCKHILEENYLLGDVGVNETIREYFDDWSYRKYLIYNDKLYKVEYTSLDPDEDIAIAKKIEGGNIEFELKYYNGGAGFDEVMDVALKNII